MFFFYFLCYFLLFSRNNLRMRVSTTSTNKKNSHLLHHLLKNWCKKWTLQLSLFFFYFLFIFISVLVQIFFFCTSILGPCIFPLILILLWPIVLICFIFIKIVARTRNTHNNRKASLVEWIFDSLVSFLMPDLDCFINLANFWFYERISLSINNQVLIESLHLHYYYCYYYSYSWCYLHLLFNKQHSLVEIKGTVICHCCIQRKFEWILMLV